MHKIQVLKFSHKWKVSQHLFFRIILTTTVNLFFSWKNFDLLDEKKTTQNLKIFTKFRQQLTVFQFLTVKGNVFFLESTEPLGVRNVQVSLAKKFYCLNLTSTTSQTLYKTREKSDKEKMSSAKTAQFRQQLGEKTNIVGFFFQRLDRNFFCWRTALGLLLK